MRLGPPPQGRILREQADLAVRVAALAQPHMTALESYRRDLARRHGCTPHADPDDGGSSAELLVLLETPGARGSTPRFVSCDNPTGTARNLRLALARAGIDRRRVVLWNAVPWVIHAAGAPNRAPRRPEIAAGLQALPDFLALLPHLRAVVAAGRVAAAATAGIASARPGVAVFTMPHPSPTYVCTSPDVAVRIQATLDAVAELLGSAGEV